MRHLMKYRFLQTIRKKDEIFWSILFPFLLSLMFFFTFMKGGETQTDMEPIPVAVVIETKNQEMENFRTFLYSMESDMLQISEMTLEEGESLMLEGKIQGIFKIGEERSLLVSASGLEESILEILLDSYNQSEAMILAVMKEHPENLEKVVAEMKSEVQATVEVSLGGKTIDGNLQYFFALIGMTCMFGSFMGITAATDLKANTSALGARRGITPTKRLQMIISDLLVTLGIHFSILVLLLLFYKYVLKLDIEGNMGGLLLVCFLGSMIGIGIGILIGSIGKASEGVKIGISVGISMICSFLAGLMFGQMKYIVETYAPIINRINPAAVISDAIYCLTVYDDQARYYQDLGILFIMSLICVAVSFLAVRRERYESI